MAVDEALLDGGRDTQPTLRLYTWARPSVSLGYREPCPFGGSTAAWLSRCAGLGVDPVRRVTGGGAVLHAGDLTYAAVVPLDAPGVPSTAHGSYAWLRGVLLAGLRSLGVEAEPSRAASGAERATLCFAGATGNEIELRSAKLVGSAQRRTRAAFLQHGSLRLANDSPLYLALFGSDPGPPPPGLAGLDHEAISEAICKALAAAVAGGLEPGDLTPREHSRARARQAARARDPLAAPTVSSSC